MDNQNPSDTSQQVVPAGSSNIDSQSNTNAGEVYTPVVVDLMALKAGDSGQGIFLIQDYNRNLDTNSKAPLNGTVHYKGKAMTFKVWKGYFQDLLLKDDFSGKVVEAAFTVAPYKDSLEVTFSTYNGVIDISPSAFYRSVDLAAVWGNFVHFMQHEISPNVSSMLSHFFNAEGITQAFQLTWAGKKMHDAQVGGLMNHTLKMLNIAKTLVFNDPRLMPYKDALYAYIVLHDIGKVYEIAQGGQYTKHSYVTHRSLGVEMISRHKAAIVAAVGEDMFYHIMAVQQGHHGKEWGDAPTTVWALMIHQIDVLDAKTTHLLDAIEFNQLTERNGQKTLWDNGTHLVV